MKAASTTTHYTAVNNSTHGERGFSAVDDDEAIGITETLAADIGNSYTLYRTLPMRKLEKVCLVLPDRGF